MTAGIICWNRNTRLIDLASVLQIAKFVPSKPQNETNFAIRTLAGIILWFIQVGRAPTMPAFRHLAEGRRRNERGMPRRLGKFDAHSAIGA